MIDYDLAIVGGGIVGLAAALTMYQHGFSVVVLDKAQFEPQHGDRVYAINAASKNLFKQINCWDLVSIDELSPYTHMQVWDLLNKAYIDFDISNVSMPELGTIVSESALKNALLAKIKDYTDLVLLPNNQVEKIIPQKNTVTLKTSQNTYNVQLMILADGSMSFCRQLLNIPVTSWPYHQDAITATVHTKKPHANTAYQVFLPDGTLAFLPLANQQKCSIVWSSNRSKYLLSLEESKFNQEITNALEGKLGQVKIISKCRSFPLKMIHSQVYTGNNWLLMGDALHTVHPLAGLGLNLGLADLKTWSECLKMHKNKLSSRQALGAYQRQRKYEVLRVIAFMQLLKNLFMNPLPPIIALRGVGMSACNYLTPIKRMFIKHAIGV